MTGPAVIEQMPTTLDESMDIVLRQTMADSLPPADVPVRDEKGRFLAASGAENAIPPMQLPDDSAPVGGPTDTVPESTEPVIPEGYVAPKVLADDKARGFTVSDDDGEILPPDLTWKITANGKERTLSTDKLVSYASMGVYNHELQQTVQQTQQHAQQVEQRYQDVQREIATRDQQIEALLTDPDFLYRAQQAYVQHNTPEARATRERQALQEQQTQLQMERATLQATQFIDTAMTPALDLILRQCPTVSQDEIAAKFFLAADRYRRNGVLMADGFDPLKQWVIRDLWPQISQLHEHRQSERQQSTQSAADAKAAAAKEVQAAQVRAQKARNQTTQATRSSGRSMPEVIPAPKITTAKQADDFVIQQTLASMRGG